MLYQSNIREEELKNKVAADFFHKYDCTGIIKDIDFAVKIGASYLLWAEAKKNTTDIVAMLAQLVLTIGKARTFNEVLPPIFRIFSKLYLMQFNAIHNEDCVKGIKRLADSSVDIVIADPPYNIGKDFGNDSDKMNFMEYISWCKLWIAECQRVLRPTGVMFIRLVL